MPSLHHLCLLLALVGFLGDPRLTAADHATVNQKEDHVFNFNPGWRLAKGSHPPEAATDDRAWERVATPHTYHEGAAYQGLKSGLKDLGPFTYRKHFTLPEGAAHRRVIVEFQGIRQRGRFWLNGHALGQVSHGVTPFGFDLTPQVVPGDNVLHVEIDCGDTEFSTGAPMCWFFPGFNPLYGGICRNVLLHLLPEVHATLPLYSSFGTVGTYVYAENISTERREADIGIDIEVAQDGTTAQQVTAEATLIAPDGREVATFATPGAELAPGTKTILHAGGHVGGLTFWQPGHPALYRVRTVVRGGDGPADVQTLTTGFRKIEVRGAEFYLNNRVLMTHGYTPRSQNEWPAVGAAYPDWLHDYSNGMMVDGHARLVRWEHIMPSPQDITSCDRVGLLQIVPGADRENDSTGREWAMRVEIMRDTIVACRNSPSVVLWEAANNVLTPAHTQDMIALRDTFDPRGSRRPMGGRSEGPEWVSWMYGVRKEAHRLSVDTEFMRDESPRRWWDAYSPPYLNTKGEGKLVDNAGGWNRNQDNICRLQAIVHEQYYNARPGTGPAICNGGIQIFFADSDTFTRGIDLFRRSGPVDGMRIPKDAYACNQTLWSNTPELWTAGKPAVFLPGHWNYPAGTVKPMYVFTSPGIARVALQVNGVDQGTGKVSNTFLWTFPEVAFQPGTVEALAYDADHRVVARSRHVTAGDPAVLHLSVIQAPNGLRADGSDLALIQTEVVDAQGRRCPLAQPLVQYRITGPAVWRGGIWEEDVPKYANKTELPVLNGVHRVFLRSTETPGTIRVVATSPGLPEATVEIPVRPVPIVSGLTTALPDTLPPRITGPAVYGPDLAPAPPAPPDVLAAAAAGSSASVSGDSLFALTTAFPQGAEIVHGVMDGTVIYRDQPWTFSGLPGYLRGADMLRVANADAVTSAGEGVVFKIGKAGRVAVAYDEGNSQFPAVSSPTPFKETQDRLTINGRTHRIWLSAPMNGGELTYLGTNSWTEQPPPGLNNYVVFILSDLGLGTQPP